MSKFKGICYQLHAFSNGFVAILAVIFTGILALCGFVCTCYAIDMDTQMVLTKWDSPLWNLLGMILSLIAISLFLVLVKNRSILAKKLLLVTTSLWIFGVSSLLIVFGKTVPAADAASVYNIASSLAVGDLSVIAPVTSYLSYYPQQIGLVSFYEPLIRLWNLLPLELPAYHFIKLVYAFLAVIIFYFQYRTIHFIFQNDRVDFIFMFLSAANLPFMMYTSFVYSEIPSFAAMSIGIYYLLHMLFTIKDAGNKQTMGNFLFALVFLTLSVLLRKNSLIIIIAILLVTLLVWCKTQKHLLLLFALLCTVCAVGILPLVQKGYELRAGNTLRSGVTATSYFAMGMQESSRGNGWYNGFNFNTYQECNMDAELTNEISRSAIEERLNYFRENPGYAAEFYLQKFLSQWADGTYACRQATLASGGRHPLLQELYAGKYSTLFIGYCNILQNLMYLGCFFFCVGNYKKKTTPKLMGLPFYLGLIGAFGGFLFHMLWEANSRYIFLYGMLLLPYAAAGIEMILSTLRHKIMTKKQKES